MNESKSSNVVRLDDHISNPGFTDRTRSGILLKHCRELASSTLISTLPIVMDKLDDALFDLANRSTDNKEQGIYFETMREVRVKRAGIETEFRRFFKESVRSTIERLAGSGRSHSLADTSSADLGLVDENDLEETLAVTNMVRKIRGECLQPLYALERRIAELLAVDELKPADNPFGPEAMCNAFKDACAQIDASVEVRLIILKLFDRHVGSEAEKLYCEINDYLVSQKVLPEIRHHVRIQPSSARATDNSAYEHHDAGPQSPGMPQPQPYPGGAGADSGEGWGSPPTPHHRVVQDGSQAVAGAAYFTPTAAVLLDALRQVMDVNFANRGGAQTPGDDHLRVIGQLTHLQHGDTQAAGEELASFDVSGVRTGLVNVLRDLKHTTVANGIGEMDTMMFDVVAMMFDFILDDKKIPAPMKALIGRLQIPILKVAILDKAFFARKFHPARKLLNTIAEAAIGWSENKDRNDALYSKLESMVGRVLEEFDERVDVFAEVLSELEAFLNQEESRAESNASTFANVIQGRERLTLARRNAEEQTVHCLEKARVHNVVQEFLIGHWKELLFVRHFEEGDTGEGWTSAVQTMKDLVWSIAPKTLNQDRNHLTEILPSLLRRVRDGMKQLGISAELSGNFLGALKNLHIAAIRNEICAGDPGDVAEVSDVDAAESHAGVDEATLDPHADSLGIDLQWWSSSSYSVEELSLIQLAVERANDVIYGTAEVRPECAGMGTTLVAVQFQDNFLTAAHVGDARLYRLRGDVFQRLTCDHSLRQQLVDKGIYTAEEVEEKVHSNIITRAVGPESSVDVEVQEIATERDDLYLLCSDGLTDMVDDVALAEILCDHPTDLDTAGRMLVDRANENGGRDNISVILARVVDAYPQAAPGDEDLELRAKLDMYGLSNVGRKRSHNEDHIALDTERGIAIVADGMGGCNAGEIASEMAVKIVLEALRDGNVDAISVTTGDGVRTSRVSAEDRFTETTPETSALLRHQGDEIVIEGLASDMAYELEEEDEYTEIIRGLEMGSWVEFYHVDGATTPARLTWLSPVTGRYLFTDRKGMKVADATVHGLAVELKRGNVAVIEGVPLFDRMIGTITDNLNAEGARAH